MSVNREPHDNPDVLTVANPMSSRRWLWVLGVALALLWALLQLSRGQWPWPLVLLPLWAVLFLLARVPLVVADGEGVRVGARRFTWSEVAAIERPADNGWKHQLPELVLKDGQRRSLPALYPDQIAVLCRLHASATDELPGGRD